jgi:hypothetical protein
MNQAVVFSIWGEPWKQEMNTTVWLVNSKRNMWDVNINIDVGKVCYEVLHWLNSGTM